ncbi:MAG: TonB-dependent receptor [Opitutaceae bacterium]|jgi:TonB-dependent receptor|nr:TonB-dependent receptor [Opitutaceae bacterium]
MNTPIAPKTAQVSRPAPRRAATAAALFSLFTFHLSLFSAPADPTPTPPARATITGRVFNAATGLYLRNAEVRLAGTGNFVLTEDGGAYAITVPAGPVTLTASYTSVQTATATLTAAPGATLTADFDLQPLIIDSRATAAGAAGPVVMLDRFVVSEERTGQAKAIMDQRAAPNAKTVIATDNFGDLTMGAIGEFLKYMPGVTIDYDEGDAAAVRVAGLDPKYASFTMDGITLASANGVSRANRFEQIPITGVESIEFNQTLTASMDAGAAAGSFNLKSKYAFDLRRPVLRFQLGLDGIGDAIELGRAYMPDDRKHYRTYPGGQLNYGGVFLKRRLGIEASVSRYASYMLNQSHETHYAYPVPDETLNPGVDFSADPAITRLIWRDGPRIQTRLAANLSLDFKITPKLILSLRNTFSRVDNEYYHLYVNLRASETNSTADGYTGPSSGTRPESTLEKWIVEPTHSTSNDTALYTGNTLRYVHDENYFFSPRLSYKNGPFQLEFRGAYSRSIREWQDGERGYFQTVGDRIGGLGWIAERPDSSSPAWNLIQTKGTDWTQPQNWNRHSGYSFGISSSPALSENTQTSAYIDLTYARRILGHPVTFKTGGGIRHSDFSFEQENNTYNYLGPIGKQMETPVPWTKNYVFDFALGGKGGNIGGQSWRADNNAELWSIFQAHPEWFESDDVSNFRRKLLASRELTEAITAAYLEATTSYGRLHLNAGLRFERTATETQILHMRTWDEILAARAAATPEQIASGMFDYTIYDETGLPLDMNTIPGVLYQYHDGRKFPRNRDYSNLFLSGGLKYDLAKNLRFQLSASQAILRPDYNNLSGVINSDIYSRTVWVPNPLLKPEKTTKYYAGLHWYLNPAGVLNLSGFRLDITDKQITPVDITAAQAALQTGIPVGNLADFDDGEEVNYRSAANAVGTRSIYGLTIEYNQQLTFLPGILKGVALFGSLTSQSFHGARQDIERIGFAAKSANGGIKYRLGRFNAQLRATWSGDRLTSVTDPIAGRRWLTNDHVYLRERVIVDLSGGFRLNRNLELAFSIRNLTDAPAIWYSNSVSRLMRYNIYGSVWNLSLKGVY